ncbi:MAG: hypothetical protein WC389_16060 [Lutibacter sp.]|jgi:hypothetical protein
MIKYLDTIQFLALLSLTGTSVSFIDIATGIIQLIGAGVAVVAGYYAICLSKEKILTERQKRKSSKL